MNEFEDQPLVKEAEPERQPDRPAAPRQPDSRLYVAIGVVALLLGAGLAWWFIRGPGMPARGEPAAVAATEGAIAPAAEPERPLPPLGQMDTYLRALIGALSSHPQLARWLATDDLIHQMADIVDKVSRGQSPAKNLGVLRPSDAFAITGTRAAMRIDPRSYRRYDALAGAVTSVNARGAADAYRTIRPRLDEAYHALGRSENSVDDAVAIALDVLLATPIPQEPIAVVHGKGATYAYADARLERLAPVQKHLLRMGPENARAILAQVREFKDALGAR